MYRPPVDNGVVIREEREHGAYTELYRASRLEIDEGWERELNPVFSVSARRGGALLGAATVSRRYDRLVLDYIAVQPEFRVKGLGRALATACADYARREGEAELWLAARTPGFFRALGAAETGGETLLGECLDCPDYGKDCRPIEMVIKIQDKEGSLCQRTSSD